MIPCCLVIREARQDDTAGIFHLLSECERCKRKIPRGVYEKYLSGDKLVGEEPFLVVEVWGVIVGIVGFCEDSFSLGDTLLYWLLLP